ncbi:biotin--[acetyl-CoA-carboxylase] ligase [Sphingobacterium oryzagri]|uniref:biotin--[biotin carboxyl-carrier protein] ligase n=1 Tax=Sphingobacterium oryzagri TaxID=3025669 RepID=A0ABY7WJ24_9SPHI|nr:biotin--[acetyl-CoA-carboxylase] ligase [Sphingobacterium sp. KACC 22765]WDF68562.1 biotin--[acetyl-CoA-carboxylase] ligase [Sphingobacterium sp. KACC 22765]
MQNNTFSRLSLRQNLIVLEEVSSTNDYLKELLSNIKPLPEATAIMAKHQTRGRGQRGSTWITQAGANLTVSFNLYPNNLAIPKLFNLNMLVCLGIRHWLASMNLSASVKWPNDIYIGDKKIGGVLIENQLSGEIIRSSIIGIGLNINQLDFPTELRHKTTSIRCETQQAHTYAIEDCSIELIKCIGELISGYDLAETSTILADYNALLFRKDVPSRFMLADQEVVGTIQGIDTTGRLRVAINGQEQVFDLKEISFII